MHANERIKALKNQVNRLELYLEQLKKAKTYKDKVEVLDATSEIKNFIASHVHLKEFFDKLSSKEQLMLKSLVLIDQEIILLTMIHHNAIEKEFLNTLSEINQFYETSHGLITYQVSILKLILEQQSAFAHDESTRKYLRPIGIDLKKESATVRKFIRLGLENLDKMGEIYPVGGAGERLKLTSADNEPLPVALLPFLGRSLLEGLIRDLQAREFLYFKLTGKQLITPVAMMTSTENCNDEHIEKLCTSNNWFHRGADCFSLFTQPMVPVVTCDGDWVLSSPCQLMCKPSGHGVIWKVASEKGVLDWFKEFGRSKMISRQINNPIAGVDYNLLGFAGAGFKDNKAFGFASCDRLVDSSEGMDVLIETKTAEGFEYKITNVEYTEFKKHNIEDQPEEKNCSISKFPANTNILFVDINEVEEAIKKCPIPGLLVNMKTTLPLIDKRGCLKQVKVGRLESTMQNIADVIVDFFSKPLTDDQYSNLKSYITFNERNKTISVAKKALTSIDCCQETPQCSFYDTIANFHQLFETNCQMKLPILKGRNEYLKQGPSFMIQFHPALGPLFSIIAQKIRKGTIAENSELQLEITEVEIENLDLDGSLLISADNALGEVDETGILQYGKNLGKCKLKNVKVKNSGIDQEAKNFYWKNEIIRLQSLTIILHGHSEFSAENVTFEGNFKFEVEDGQRLRAFNKDGNLQFLTEKIEEGDNGTAFWSYAFDEEDHIILQKVNSEDVSLFEVR